MNKCFLVILLWAITSSLYAQIETDRPDFTESPNVVPKGALQVETGFVLENDKNLIKGQFPGTGIWEEKHTTITLNTTLLRYGLTENIELRLNYALNQRRLKEFNVIESGPWLPQDFQPADSFFNPVRSVSPAFVGFKTNLYKSDKFSIGFLGHIYLPWLATDGEEADFIAPEFLIPLTYDVTDKFSIAVQYGLSWDGFTPNPTTSYTLALGYSITDKLSFYVEPYGFLTNSGDELHLINGGFTYLINDDFIIDLTGGMGLSEAAPDNFINCGASFLLFNK